MAETKKQSVMAVIERVAMAPPRMWNVWLINDDATTMEFVVETLIEFFGYTEETAAQITVDIHDAGSAIVAVLPFEIAEQKGGEVTLSARAQNFPLQVRIEPDVTV